MSSKNKKKGVDGHEASRRKVCIICLKRSDQQLTSSQIEGLKKFTGIFDSILHDDLRVPTGICKRCKTTLEVKKKGSDRVFAFPEGFSFVNNVIIPKTRSAEANFCNCILCTLAKQKGNPKKIVAVYCQIKLLMVLNLWR